MTKKLFRILIFTYIWINITPSICAQIKVGDNPKTISSNALFELESKNKGFLLPRLDLQSTTKPDPLTSFEIGMMVFNTSLTNDVSPGLYFSDGTKWIKVNTTILQNASTTNNVQSTNYISTNNQTIFQTPMNITDANKVLLYRNGVLITFTVTSNNTIMSEIPCVTGDKIKIIQLL